VPITATVDNATACVLIFVDYSTEAGTQNRTTVVRIAPDGTETPVRGATDHDNLNGLSYFYDCEAPLDTAVTYRATATPDNVTLVAGPVTIVSSGFVWFKDPLRPWASLRLDLCSQPDLACSDPTDPIALINLGAKTRAGDFTLPSILNAERPADIFARRKDITTSVTFASRTLAAIDDIYTLFTVGGPLFLQMPAAYGWPDKYFQPGDLVETPIGQDRRRPWRLWEVPLTAVDQPSPNALPQGTTCANWCLVEDTFPTFADLTALATTWANILDGGAPLC
jgi:hypothetical protein